jgi:TetR/AcrR family transcriptional regulator, tetracycline repressor protein
MSTQEAIVTVTYNEQPHNDRIRPGPAEKREALTMERVVETALAIVDRDGLSKLSMRKLGAELGVDPMAVYHYIPNKAALLDGLIEAVMNELGVACTREPSEDITEWFVCAFHTFWEVLRSHPNVLTVMATRPITGDAGLRSAERILYELHGIGLPAEDAMAALMSLTTMTIAIALAEAGRSPENMDPSVRAKIENCYMALPPAEFPLFLEGLAQPPAKDWSQIFDFSIRVFVTGLVGIYAAKSKNPADRACAVTAG